MTQTIESGRKRTSKVPKVSRRVKILAGLDEYGVYWDECIPDIDAAQNFLNRLEGNERLRKVCLKLKELNITIELEQKFDMKSDWIKVNVFTSNEDIISFLTRTR